MTLVLISLVIGAAAGWFICYAVDMECGMAKNVAVCTLGALIGGALIPALTFPFVLVSIIGAALGTLILFTLYQRAFYHN